MNDRPRRWRHGPSYRLAVMALLGLGLACAGGASRADEDQQMLVRLAAIAALALSAWPLEAGIFRRYRGALMASAGAWLVVAVQLVPLPPDWWAHLPGHAPYADIASASGHVVWRPGSLTPDLTLNALFALLPATAAGIGTLFLDFRGRAMVARGIVLIALASAMIGLIQQTGGAALHLYRQSSADAPVGLFANRNHQAVLMACALPLTAAIAALRDKDGGDARATLATMLTIVAVLLLALVSTGSRMGLLLGAIGCAGAILCYRPDLRRLGLSKMAARAAGGAGAILALSLVGLAAVRGGALHRLAVTDPASETRMAMIRPLVEMARTFLPTGAGFGSFDPVYRQFEPNGLLSTIYMNQAHDELLQLAIEGGLPALFLLGLFLCWWGATALRIVRMPRASRRRTMALAALSVTVILLLSSLVDYPLRTPLLGAVFVIACVEMLCGAAPDEARAAPSSSRRVPAPAV